MVNRRSGAIAVFLALATFTACAKEDPDGYLGAKMRGRSGAASMPRDYRTISDLLPNVTAERNGKRYRPAAAAIVGRIIDVSKGAGFAVVGDDAPDGKRVDFDDRKVKWKTVHFDVQVSDDFGESKWVGDTVRIGLSIDGDTDFAKTKSALLGYGTVVVFLKESSAVFSYDSSVHGVLGSGTMLATIDEGGTLNLPFLNAEEANDLLGDTKTIDALKSESRKPPRVIGG